MEAVQPEPRFILDMFFGHVRLEQRCVPSQDGCMVAEGRALYINQDGTIARITAWEPLSKIKFS